MPLTAWIVYDNAMTFQWQHPYKLLSRREFATRYVRLGFIATPILLGSLALGVCGYHYTEGIPWLDSLLNASMILGGMGPVDPLHTKVGKLFASFYALYSGLLLISLAGLMLAPVVHRLLHKFHIEIEKPEDSKAEGAKSTTDKADED